MAQECFSQGNEAFVDEDYNVAIARYSEAIKLSPQSAKYYLKRAAAYAKVDKHKDAVEDAEKSLKVDEKNDKAFFRKGTSLFALEEFAKALQVFKEASDIAPENEEYKTWIRKCEAEINLKLQCGKDSSNVNIALSNYQFSKTADKGESICPLKMNMQKQDPQQMGEHVIATAINIKSSEKDKQPQMAIVSKIKHDWYQTDTFVIITVLIKNIKKEDINVEYSTKSLSLTVKLGSGSNYCLELDLAHSIKPDDCVTKVLSTKLELKLKKEEGIRWSSLEIDNESHFVKTLPQNPLSTSEKEDAVHKYPSSSATYRDWDRLAKEVQEEEKKEEDSGDAALNKLFKQIYSDGSDEVKRAMNKSFQESGGTVLSTNWKDVRKEKVEVKPPDCMEYKKYEI